MEKKPLNAADRRIDRMVSELRETAVQDTPESLIQALTKSQNPAVKIRTPLLRYGLVTAGLIAAAVAVWPRESSAAILDRVLQAANDNLFRHEIAYTQAKDGSFQVFMERYIQGNKWRVKIPSSHMDVVSWPGGQLTYFTDRGYAIVEGAEDYIGTDKPKDSSPSIKRLLAGHTNPHIDIQRNILWEGKKVDQYRISSNGKDALGQTLHSDVTLYAESGSDRPLYEQAKTDGFPQNAYRWRYPKPDSKIFDFSLPKGTPLYDLPQQRRVLKDVVRNATQKTTVNGIPITLRAVIVDHRNGVMAITTGGEGRIERDPQCLQIEGLTPGRPYGAPIMDGGFWNDKFVFRAPIWEGMKLVGEYADFGKDIQIPEKFLLRVPIWIVDDALPCDKGTEKGRRFIGYASFEVEHPIRTSYVNQLVCPVNLNIFSDVRRPDQPTKAAPGKDDR